MATKNPRVLALDLASSTGWAFRSGDGSIETGVTLFLGTVPPGSRWIRFNAWLDGWAEAKPEIVVYEEPIFHHRSGGSAQCAFGFSTRVEEFCARRDIPCKAVNNWTLKRWATGSHMASKDLMRRYAQSEGWPLTQPDEIDARWLLEFTIRKLLKLEGVA